MSPDPINSPRVSQTDDEGRRPENREDRDRVLYVIHHREYSGAELLHLPLMRSDPDALLACPPGSRTEQLAHSTGIDTVALPFRQLRHSGGALETLRSAARGVRAAWDLRRILRRHPDRSTVYGIALRPGMIAAIAALGLRRRIVWYLPDCLPPPGPVRTLAVTLARLRADVVIAISEFVLRDAGRSATALGRRTEVVRPGVDVARFSSSAVEPGGPRAVVLGHLSPTKRTDLALDAAERVLERAPDFRLDIVGRALYRDEDFAFERDLERRVADDDRLHGRVRFCGFSEDIAGSFTGAGMLLHCRDDEPFGMALVEAMASGLPVIAPRAGGPLEIVEDGVTGVLYPPGDVDAAAEAIITLIRDPALARRMGDAGRARVKRCFDAERQSRILGDAIESA